MAPSTLSLKPPPCPRFHPWARATLAHGPQRRMSGIAHSPAHISIPIGRRRRVDTPIDELRSRRTAGDFTHLPPILPETYRPPSPSPDYDKDLPRIPSTSTEICGDEAVTVFTDSSGSLTTSPIVGCPPLPVPSKDVHGRVPITEAQQIAARYRQRHRGSYNVHQRTVVPGRTIPNVSFRFIEPPHAFPLSTVTQSGVSVDIPAMNATIGASLALQSPSISQALAEEMEAVLEGASLFSQVHEDGTVSCARGDCQTNLPSLKAFLCHLHVHLIHEGYVVPL